LLGGLGNVDDCILYLPSGKYRAFAPRAYDPATRTWSIWWLDGRRAGRLDPPVRGVFTGTEGEFQGLDDHEGTPVTVRFRWHDTHSKRPWWDQAFSTDQGKSWEINWRNYFTRVRDKPSTIPVEDGESLPLEAFDWSWLPGHWKVQNERRRPDGKWEKFPSTLRNRPVMCGLGNVGDNLFEAPGGTYRGVSLRAFDREARVWRSWWLDGRNPRDIGPALEGRFDAGTGKGSLIGGDIVRGKQVRVRSLWTRVGMHSAHWEQASSDDGERWETNWVADLVRVPG
jgi:hypothetical protein